MKSFFQEYNDVCEAYWGSKELCHSFRHPWTWILGWFSNSLFGLSIHFIIACQVGFIPCNVSNFIEPYTFTIVNGLSGMKLDFLLKLEEPCPLYSLTDHKSQVSSFFCVIPFVRTKKRCSSNFFTKLSLQSCSPMLTQMFLYHPVM